MKWYTVYPLLDMFQLYACVTIKMIYILSSCFLKMFSMNIHLRSKCAWIVSTNNGFDIEDQIQNYAFIENIGVPRGIVCGYPCLLTSMKRNSHCGLAIYR